MRTSVLTALVGGLVFCLLPAGAKEVKAPEKATYKMVSVTVDGQEVPPEHFKDIRLHTDGNKYVVKMGDKVVEEGTAKVDQTKKPWTIDRTVTSGRDKGKTFKGIMEVTGNKARVCWAQAGKPRPKKFASEKGSGNILETIERVQE